MCENSYKWKYVIVLKITSVYVLICFLFFSQHVSHISSVLYLMYDASKVILPVLCFSLNTECSLSLSLSMNKILLSLLHILNYFLYILITLLIAFLTRANPLGLLTEIPSCICHVFSIAFSNFCFLPSSFLPSLSFFLLREKQIRREGKCKRI